MTSLYDIFSLVCGQQHNWMPGGQPLPFCQRCTGLYVGAVLAFPAFLLFRPKPTSRMLWVHGMFLLAMVPFGYHFVVQTGEIRMLTGQLFAIGLVYYLMLLPGGYWPYLREPLFNALPGYCALSLLAVLLLLAMATQGGARTNALLSWIGFVGLLLYAILVILNVALVTMSGRDLLRRRISASRS